ncbi:MAG: alpha/beta hydrolase [Acidiferrobacterales bacterium]
MTKDLSKRSRHEVGGASGETISDLRILPVKPAKAVEMPMLTHRYVLGCLLLFLVALSVSCVRAPAGKIPISTLSYTEKGTENRSLIVLLPGIRDQLDKYERQGFVDALRNRGLAIDLIAVDAHFGYYTERSIVERLKVDVVEPAKAQGYNKIWLVGVSLGGLGSLLYSMHYPNDVEGALILAPYLGESDLISEIAQAGGPANWQPGTLSEEVGFRELWAWLKNYNSDNNDLPLLYLGYGRWDKFETAGSLLASILPPEHVYVISGLHNWWTWRKLWGKALDEEIFTRAALHSRTRLASSWGSGIELGLGY